MGEHRSAAIRRIVQQPLVSVPAIFIAGIVFWGGFNTSLEITNTESFCISCHEMKDNVYQEYQAERFISRTAPACGPPARTAMFQESGGTKSHEKFAPATSSITRLLGSIDTPEKFRTKRLELARQVWKSMEDTDSRECRNCHSFVSMDLGVQKDVAEKRHVQSVEQGKTCIDCHKGIAHELPEEFLEAEHERFEREKVACADCHEDMAQAPSDEEWDWDKQD